MLIVSSFIPPFLVVIGSKIGILRFYGIHSGHLIFIFILIPIVFQLSLFGFLDIKLCTNNDHFSSFSICLPLLELSYCIESYSKSALHNDYGRWFFLIILLVPY